MLQTYRDKVSGKIYTQDGKLIPDIPTYQSLVRTQQVSGTPLDISQMPSVTRDGADILTKSGLDQWKSGANLVEAARSIIQMKQGYNADIKSAKEYWRNKSMNTAPFEGETQKAFQQMKPAEQASIRAKQWATSEAHLAGLSEEEKYRGVRTEDTLKYISDIYSEKIKELENQKADANEKERIKIAQRQNEIETERNRILSAKDLRELGIEPTAKDIYGTENSVDYSRIGFKQGGSLSWRSNNPGNIKFGDFTKKYGATQGPQASDGGYYSIFPDEETGRQAMKDLLLSSRYQKLTVEKAMRLWSNNAYGAEVFNKDYATMPLSTVTSQMIDKLVDGMIKREGWKEGTAVTQIASKELQYLSDLTETPIDELKSLNLFPAELKLFISIAEAEKKKISSQELETTQHTKLYDEADKKVQEEMKKLTSPNLVYGMLVRQYSPKFTIEEIKTIMTQNGYEWDSIRNRWRETIR